MNRSGFAIEALFPDAWILEAEHANPEWFEDISLDASGGLISFVVKDPRKAALQDFLRARAEEAPDASWRNRWDAVANALEGALANEELRVSRADN